MPSGGVHTIMALGGPNLAAMVRAPLAGHLFMTAPSGALLFRLNLKRAGWAGTRPSRLSPLSGTVKPIPSRTVASCIILGSAAPCKKSLRDRATGSPHDQV